VIEQRVSVRNDPAYMLAVLYTIGFLGMSFLVATQNVPSESKDIVQYLMGIMSAVQLSIINYYYGSSKAGSDGQKTSDDRKIKIDDIITDIARKASNLPPDKPSKPLDSPLSAENVNIEAKGDVNVTKDKP
jgi:hypothetical protein